MTPVIIESPFAGCVPLHRAYLQACIRDCLGRGETPYASHQMITDALDDLKPEERTAGIEAGLAMANQLRSVGGLWLFYTDLGWSGGMTAAVARSGDGHTERELGDIDSVWDRIIDDAADRFASAGEKAKLLHLYEASRNASERENALYIKAHWARAA